MTVASDAEAGGLGGVPRTVGSVGPASVFAASVSGLEGEAVGGWATVRSSGGGDAIAHLGLGRRPKLFRYADRGSLYDLAGPSADEHFDRTDETAVGVRTADAAEPAGRIEDGERCIGRRIDALRSVQRNGLTATKERQLVPVEHGSGQPRDGGGGRQES